MVKVPTPRIGVENGDGLIVRRHWIPLPLTNVRVRGGFRAAAGRSTPGTSPRIPHGPDVDRQQVGVSADQRLGEATRTKRRIRVAAHTPRGYDEGPLPGKRPGQRPFSLGGRCRIRTCVGIRRRIYSTSMPIRSPARLPLPRPTSARIPHAPAPAGFTDLAMSGTPGTGITGASSAEAAFSIELRCGPGGKSRGRGAQRPYWLTDSLYVP